MPMVVGLPLPGGGGFNGRHKPFDDLESTTPAGLSQAGVGESVVSGLHSGRSFLQFTTVPIGFDMVIPST